MNTLIIKIRNLGDVYKRQLVLSTIQVSSEQKKE